MIYSYITLESIRLEFSSLPAHAPSKSTAIHASVSLRVMPTFPGKNLVITAQLSLKMLKKTKFSF